jgi:predicted MFS family arabinose efflux permease
MLLWLAPNSAAAHAGVALTGCGFSLVFPALGVEAVRNVAPQSRGSALGIYTAFIDLSLGVSGPVAGAFVSTLGYPSIFLFAAVMVVAATGMLIALYWKALRAPETGGHHEIA